MKKGQALIETLIAISVLAIGFMGVIGLLSRSLGLNRVVADNYTATYLAAEGLEVVKNILDSNTLAGNWDRGINSGDFEVEYGSIRLESNQNRFLVFDPGTRLYSYNGPQEEQTPFRRKITIAFAGQDEVKVNSLVSWTTRGGGTFEVDVEDHFFDWRKYAED